MFALANHPLFCISSCLRIRTYFLVFLILTLMVRVQVRAEACKFVYKGAPEELNGTTITVPDEIVALSEYHYVPSPTDTISDSVGRPAIFFIIDHSSSMYQDANKNTPDFVPANDSLGYRFNVTRDLIQYLYNVFPTAEVGYAIFARRLYFDPDDDPRFEEVTGQTKMNAFLPFLRLNQDYNGRLGYEILTKYLKTDTIIPPQWNQWEPDMWVDLVTDPGEDIGISTHINLGFDAAKQAMAKTQCKKRKQNIIFLSDGDAKYPPDNSKFDFVKGTNVPKTFTIFFTQSLSVPPNISNMTKNIQNNGYSSHNKNSKAWAFKNTNYDSLMNFLMKNVINQILGEKSNTPTGMAINGGAEVNNWDSVGFTFPKLFPLTEVKTDFSFKIDYHVIKDTIDDTGGIIEIEYDTTTNTDFSVVINENAGQLPDTFLVQCWDRKIEFYHEDTLIQAADGTMSELELRFTEIMIDILYGYHDVSIELTNFASNTKDREIIKLKQEPDYLTKTFKIAFQPNPTPGNDLLELQNNDSIIAIFKNQDIPLDTLYVSIPYTLNGVIAVKSAYYFDEKEGDGLIDSIYLEVESEIVDITQEIAEEIVGSCKLPSWRKLTITKVLVVDKGISLLVHQASSVDTVTFVTDQDILKVTGKILNNGGWYLQSADLAIQDRIPPLVEIAHVLDYHDENQDDILTIAFSEKINQIDHNEPFLLKSMPNSEALYIAVLNSPQAQDSIISFNIEELKGLQQPVDYINDQDSLWIFSDDPRVHDRENNAQDHPLNRRRPVTVERAPIPLTLIDAYYYDEQFGDGLIDSITITFDCEEPLSISIIDSLIQYLELPPNRQLTITSHSLDQKTISLKVLQGDQADTITYVTSADSLNLKEKILENGAWDIKLVKSIIPVGDKIPPLIESARAINNWEKDDSLWVAFTEKIIPVATTKPFLFKSMHSNGALYQTELTFLDHLTDSILVFRINAIGGIDTTIGFMMSGDSIWIATNASHVVDSKLNLQDHPDNRRRVLTATNEAPPVILIPQGVTPILLDPLQNQNGTPIPPNLIGILDPLNQIEVIENNNSGMIIQIKPLNPNNLAPGIFSMEGHLSIFDAVGNSIVKNRRMGYDQVNKTLVFVWDGKNLNRRFVGSGAYLVNFDILSKIKIGSETATREEEFRLMIGVKK